jgi:hypothetical protein
VQAPEIDELNRHEQFVNAVGQASAGAGSQRPARPALWKGAFEGCGRGSSILRGNCGVASPSARGAWLSRRGVAGYFGGRGVLIEMLDIRRVTRIQRLIRTPRRSG